MRIFWAAIGVLLIITAALIVIGAEGSGEQGAEPVTTREAGPSTPGATRSPTAPSGERTASRSAPAADPEDEQISTEVRAFNLPIDQVRKHFQAADERTRSEAAAQAEIVERSVEPSTELEATAAEQSPPPQLDTTVTDAGEPEFIEPAATETTAIATPESPDTMSQELVDSIVAAIMDDPAGEPESEMNDSAPTPEQPLVLRDDRADAPASKPTDNDGRMLDGRFVIAGAGTPDDPYVVNWSLLSSASETFDPRLGKTELPERIKMLNGAHVRITGFVAFPFMVQESSELLMMQNQWDGCCLGVPPTAYDAIEVTLKDPANRLQRMLDYGAVEGVLKVDPYVRGNWLISLYMMENAQLAPEM